ncbi:Nse1 non-SMC component of SMC5-6 complex-domain-containing protein [Ampelomyces quisqualis]|uniref:Non-structural maintenance of chromosomes element 1 homolog n=1 Tax=Ampelomyces quisqualis TaxID=50730 RepID=A0A6A5R1H6_AMPQU|nr:Nse1 non-SMC component of SMC5-6 complex-domain-containing protein [Ampelomyces quisqualis]
MSRSESPLVREPSPDEGYTYMHRAFLQAFITHNVLTAENIKPILASIMTAHTASPSDPNRPWTPGDVTPPILTSTIQTVNAKLEPYDLEIRSQKSQHPPRSTVYALVNKTSDSLTQLATKFSAAEIAYIRRVLDYMFDTNNSRTREVCAIRHSEASQLARVRRTTRHSQPHVPDNDDEDDSPPQHQDTGISIQEADNLLSTLVSQSFFQKSHAGYYSLAPRALMELRAYLKETYNEPASAADGEDAVVRIRDCEGCRDIVTHGVRCDNRDCGVRWHDACANAFYAGRRRQGGRGCPTCGTECSGQVFVGERADRVAGNSRRSAVQREQDGEE